MHMIVNQTPFVDSMTSCAAIYTYPVCKQQHKLQGLRTTAQQEIDRNLVFQKGSIDNLINMIKSE